MEFTIKQTNIAKGVAICLMFAHHLYAFKDRLLIGNNYIPLIPFINVELYIGYFGNICISMFLFLSGYGMFLGYLHSEKKLLYYSINKLKSFYLKYWLYFLIFVPIGIFFFPKVTFWHSNQVRYSPDIKIFLENFVGWSSTYNSEWWFVWNFIISLLFLFPIYTILVDKNISFLFFLSILLWYFGSRINPYGHLGFIYWQISFALGIICAKLNFFSSYVIKEFDKSKWIVSFVGVLLCYMVRTKLEQKTYDFLIVPFFIYFSCRAVKILNLSKLMAYLGKYSFPLWLTHSFFCYYYFQNIIYSPKLSPLIFILLTTMSLLSVLGIELLGSYFIKVKNLFLRNVLSSKP
ncbi:acyltransferase family protein [Nostoc sp. FACHB-280]|uniref:acyltransferase family protein n=1 Tax=Nostoc sp. FACHB-280 TaxID=2692839 RepID=UPI00168B44E5|nr:acyltransferase family protein [Nostoc sp. FACHB-280]MBD2498711.1 acyltransferase family protein [Nostoc sp. FACHB-280]